MTDTARHPFVASNQSLFVGLCALAVGQILFLFGFGFLYVAALLYILAVGLPYPRVLRSATARLLTASLLALSIVQVGAIVQFFVFPATRFDVLSFIVTLLTTALTLSLRNIPRERIRAWSPHDLAGLVAALCFVVPVGLLCFWGNDLARLATFASAQGSDGNSHYTILASASNTQHLDYRETTYYPKGFHLSSAFLMHGLHINQHDQSWATNARIYTGMYLVWGAVLAYFVIALAAQLRSALPPKRRPPPLVLAIAIGPLLAGIYLAVFTQEGFLSFFYICAALMCAFLYAHEAQPDLPHSPYYIAAYLLLTCGIAMSWGPLLTPALLAIPFLYLLFFTRSLKTLFKLLRRKPWPWLGLGIAAHLAAFYLHLRYADLSAEQGLNATGGLKEFHYGLVIAGLILTTYLLQAPTVPKPWRQFAGNALLPLFIILGAVITLQLITVGELRYYSIKIAYLLEVILLAAGATALASLFTWRSIIALYNWIAVPLVLIIGVTLLAGITANPFDNARILLGNLAHPDHHSPAIRHYPQLGLTGGLSMNTTTIYRDPAASKLTGNATLTTWAHLMQYSRDNTPEIGACNGEIFKLQTHHRDAADHEQQLTTAVKNCINATRAIGKSYTIITDQPSLPYLQKTFGTEVHYLY